MIRPDYLNGKNRFEKFLISDNARSYDQSADGNNLNTIIKIPFTVNKQELLSANNPALKVAGFGPFFGGAGLISIIILSAILIRNFRRSTVRSAIWIILVLSLSIFLNPESWWARFTPQIWLLPVVVLLLAASIDFPWPFLKNSLFVALLLSIFWAFSGLLLNVMISAHVNYQIAQLKKYNGPIEIEYCNYRDMRSNRIRFFENHIAFQERDVVGQHIYNIIHSNTRFETNMELPQIPEPWLMKLRKKLGGGQLF
jgi:hypothetical protein